MKKKKRKMYVPMHSIYYIGVDAFLLGINITLIILRFLFKIYTIDPFYLIVTAWINLQLIVVAFLSLDEWEIELAKIMEVRKKNG